MPRWQPDAAGRLQQAALELFFELGYERTTVALIAERAGLTERTFFRHFRDKREVLFAGSAELQGLLVDGLDDVPVHVGPLDALADALEQTSDFFEQRRDFACARQTSIEANPELQERELTKLAALANALAGALQRRGVGRRAATLIAEVGIAAFKVAFERWVSDDGATLAVRIREAFDELSCAIAGRTEQHQPPD